MENLYVAAIEEVRKERSDHLAALSDIERSEFLAQLLSETNDRPSLAGDIDEGFVLEQSADGDLVPDREWFAESNLLRIRPRIYQWGVRRNGNFLARCGCGGTPCSKFSHGTSYMTVDYNYGMGRGEFDIIVYLRHYGEDYYGDHDFDYFVNAPMNYRLWRSGRLFGQSSPQRAGYFRSGNNQTPGLHAGTMGVAAFLPGTNTRVWGGLWFNFRTWDTEWLMCGHDYGFWIQDANSPPQQGGDHLAKTWQQPPFRA